MLLEREAARCNWKKAFLALPDRDRERADDRFSALSTDIALSPLNLPLNRYYNMIAYDHSRIKVDYAGKDIYINANLVEVPEAEREYILTQGPLEKTVDDFWLMVWQQQSSVIVMLCNLVEAAREKSYQYWPLEVGHTMVLGEVRQAVALEVTMVDSEVRGHYTTRVFSLTDTVTGENRTVKQFHYADWPDFNVPDSPDNFLAFLQDVRQSGWFSQDSGPPVVHCSAGVGRSGTLCLVDSCLNLPGELTLKRVLDTLVEMRTYRMGLIQTEEQLRFSVDAIVEGLKMLRTGVKERKYLNGKRLKEVDGEEESDDNQTSPKRRKNSQS